MKTNLKKIPKGIWALGFTSMFMDLSSELIHAVLPIFMVTTIGASMMVVGMIEGASEAISLILKIFSGAISDHFGKRKFLTVIGYGLSTITKPFFPLADSVTTVFTARFLDRVGKGIRGAPRDALVGDIAPAEIRGECFGLRQTLDTIGAFAAPLLAFILLLFYADNLRLVMWIASIPAVICIIILIYGVKEPVREKTDKLVGFPLRLSNIKLLHGAFWPLVFAASLITAARFSDAFLLLKAQSVHISLAYIPLVLVAMNFVYAVSAYPVGVLSDKISRDKVLTIGIVVLVISNIILAFANSIWLVILGTAVWGLHMGITQGLLAAMVTDKAPAELRGTAYGMFNLFCGVAMLISGVIGGVLWDNYGPDATFLLGSALALTALFFIKK